MKEHYDRDIFFAEVRHAPFPGYLTQQQVDGMNSMFAAWEPLPYTDRRWLSYSFATALAETGTMQPREEVGKGAGHSYGIPDPITGQTYYGRGLVQLTWKANYEKATTQINTRDLIGRQVDLVNQPEQALEEDISAIVLYQGMAEGWFTSHKLPDYFTEAGSDWVNARKIVNGLDRANEIAGYGQAFQSALTAAATVEEPEQPEQPEPEPTGRDPITADLVARLKDRLGASHIIPVL